MQTDIVIPDPRTLELPVNTAYLCYQRCQEEWHALTPTEQAFAKLQSAPVWHRYIISQKFGKQTLNILRERNAWTHS